MALSLLFAQTLKPEVAETGHEWIYSINLGVWYGVVCVCECVCFNVYFQSRNSPSITKDQNKNISECQNFRNKNISKCQDLTKTCSQEPRPEIENRQVLGGYLRFLIWEKMCPPLCSCVCAGVCVCVRACVRVCVHLHVCVHFGVCRCARACA